jgi:hypothetical protein
VVPQSSIDDNLGKRCDIAQAHVEALPGDWMDQVRRVTHEREAFGDKRAGDEEAERVSAASADRGDLAKMQLEAALQLGMKRAGRQRHNAIGFRCRLGPDDGGAAPRERQDGKRSCGEEMLFGAAAVIPLMADIGNNRGLSVLPAVCRDAGALADRRACPVGRGKQTRLKRDAVDKVDDDAIGLLFETADGGGAKVDTQIPRLGFQCRGQQPVLDHMSERLARRDVAGEGQKHRPHGVVEPAVGHDHVEDRLRLAGHALPDAESLKQAAHGSDDRRRPLVAVMAAAEQRVGDDDGRRVAKPLPKCNRKRQSGEAAAGDQYVDRLVIPDHTQRLMGSMDRSRFAA